SELQAFILDIGPLSPHTDYRMAQREKASAASIAASLNSRPPGLTVSKQISLHSAAHPPSFYEAAAPGQHEQIASDRRKRTVDALFLLDATGSMKETIDTAKAKINEIATQIQRAEGYELRVGFVAYRDFDITSGLEVGPFTYDLNLFKEQLGRVKATSALYPNCKVDDPEDVFSGFVAAAHMDWRSSVRVIIHIGDAPCHGRAYHDLPADWDNFPDGDPQGRNSQELLRILRINNKVNLYQFLHLNNTTKKMVQRFKQEVNADLWFQEMNLRDFEFQGGFVKGVLDAVHSSIQLSTKGTL
ncbi:hypothetical protein DUNSADRAFT_7088, partial [Dunaliella salina]